MRSLFEAPVQAKYDQYKNDPEGLRRLLAEGLTALPHVQVRKPESNAVFVIMKPEHIVMLQQDFAFLEWDANIHEIRLMCNFHTTAQEVADFVRAASACAG